MPRSTARFQFEWKMMGWALRFSRTLTGENRCFLLIVDAEGAVRQLHFGEGELEYDQDSWRALMGAHPSWLFYHPFDGPVHTFMQWQDIERGSVERLMGERFEDADLAEPVHPEPGTAGLSEFPSTWSVMF